MDSQRIRKGFLGETDWPKLIAAAGQLSEALIFIDDTPALSVLEMKAKARRLKAENGLGLVILDYLQLMKGGGSRDSREQEISEISRSLKALAKELAVPVIALSQLNRKVEDRTNRRPQMADPGSRGHRAGRRRIAFIYRDEGITDRRQPREGHSGIIIGKQRNAPRGPSTGLPEKTPALTTWPTPRGRPSRSLPEPAFQGCERSGWMPGIPKS